jgi:hypothetical protein
MVAALDTRDQNSIASCNATTIRRESTHPCSSKDHNHGRCSLASSDRRVGHWLANRWLTECDVYSQVVLTECADQGRYNPGPLAAKLVDEPGEKYDRSNGFNDTVDTGPKRDVAQSDRREDGWAVLNVGKDVSICLASSSYMQFTYVIDGCCATPCLPHEHEKDE